MEMTEAEFAQSVSNSARGAENAARMVTDVLSGNPWMRAADDDVNSRSLGFLGALLGVLITARGIRVDELDAPKVSAHARETVRRIVTGQNAICCPANIRESLDAAVLITAELMRNGFGGLDTWRQLMAAMLYVPSF